MSTAEGLSLRTAQRRLRWPATLWIGLLLIASCEMLLLADLLITGRGAIRSDEQILQLPEPRGPLATAARFAAANITPLAWLGYILCLDGILAIQRSGSPVRTRPHHFAMLCLASVSTWCIFDAMNFYSIRAWTYIGVPPDVWDRLWGYFIAFGSIVPGIMMSGQLLMNLRLFDRARGSAWLMRRWVLAVSFIAGAAMLVWPMMHHDPVTNLTLWTSLVFLLDPINYVLGRPSMLGDWSSGWYGRTLAAFAGGLLCGLLWEFWNYWAISKWVYHLPFLGALEQVRYFEMPVIGLLGFLPFGIGCWIIWQTMRIPLDDLVEPLPDERTLL